MTSVIGSLTQAVVVESNTPRKIVEEGEASAPSQAEKVATPPKKPEVPIEK